MNKFCGGRVIQSLYKVKALILIEGEITTLTFDVVDTDLPLLLGKQTMKKWNLVICTRNRTCTRNEQCNKKCSAIHIPQ